MMKTLFSFLSAFLFSLGFGQKLSDTLYCYNMMEKDADLYKKLVIEGKNINYEPLAKLIIDNIDNQRLKRPNLIFLVDEIYYRSPWDEEPCHCCFTPMSTNPNYNEETFWKKKNVAALLKKIKKNVIPEIDYSDSFVYNKPKKEGKYYKFISKGRKIYYRIIYNIISKKDKGIYRETYLNKAEERKFLYFPYNRSKNLVLEKDGYNHSQNFDELKLKFTNSLGGKVSVTYLYDNEYDNAVTKTYQYQNKTWVEIPTKKNTNSKKHQ